ncbi:MAG: 4-hydroxybutyrate CoA-transferase, partial [Bacteroidetes bacterium]|nr:4-hydroxybutyrate CoA-transferase [Bacteroidota bacterium]
MVQEISESTKTKSYFWLSNYKSKLRTADEAVQIVKSGDKIVMHGNCAFPMNLINALVNRKDELENVSILHALTVGDIPYLNPGMEKHFIHNSFFMGASARKAVNDGRADFSPIYLYEYPLLFSKGAIKPDFAFVHLSPPDEHGFCSYGVEVGIIKTAAENSQTIIAQVNPNMPRALGDSFIHINKINYIVEVDEPITELPQEKGDLTPQMQNVYTQIGRNIAELIEDGSTLQ